MFKILRMLSALALIALSQVHSFGQKQESSLDSIKRVFDQIAKSRLVNALQADPYVPNLIPPSPNASSLGKHTDFPVNIYNGVPSIPIPIYQVKSRNITVPITLNYHASGIKVGEVASWVGLGWSLEAGGLITRSAKSLPDEEPTRGFFATRSHYPNPDAISFSGVAASTWQTDVVEAAKGTIDFEQDLYMLNAMGKSYKLLFKSDGTILTVPRSDLKITADLPNNTWEVVLEDGTKLAFGGANYTELTEGDAAADVPAFGSSWYLKSITSHQGDVVNFTYTYSTIETDIAFAESDYIKIQEGSTPQTTPIINSNSTKITSKFRNIAILRLSSITSELATVTFLPKSTQREDLTGDYALDKISITPKAATQAVEEYQFSYVYSNAVSSGEYNPSNKAEYSKRLKLTRIERKVGTALSQPWVFSYNSKSLPSRRSYAQDNFGYYNGAINNTTQLPAYHIDIPFITGYNPTDYGFFPSAHVLGANREPNESSMQAEILSSIQYPTGGKTSFYFEANGYTTSVETFDEVTQSVQITPNVNNPSVFFTLNKAQYVNVNFQGFFSNNLLTDFGDNTVVASVNLRLNDANFTSVWSVGIKKNQLVSGGFSINNYINVQNIPNGSPNYSLTISTPITSQNPNDFSINASIKSQYSTTTNGTKLVGGLRLRKMLTDDGLGAKATEHFYQYESPFVINPISLSDYMQTTLEQTGNIVYTVYTRNSSAKAALGSIQGGTIGYGKITTLTDSLGTNGKTVSFFSNVADEGTTQAKEFPYPPTNPREHRRGLLTLQTDYRADNTKVKEVENFYDFPFVASISGVKSGYNTVFDACTDAYGFCGITFAPYLLSTEQVNKIKTIERTYEPSGVYAVETTTEYFYENTNYTQVSKTITTDGRSAKVKVSNNWVENRAIETTFKYPYDYTGNTILSGMVTAHIFTPVIEKTTQLSVLNTSGVKTFSPLSYEKTTFDKYSNTFYLPKKIETQVENGVLQTAIDFLSYDSRANLTQYKLRNGQTTTLDWYATTDNGKTNLLKTQTVGGGSNGTVLSRSTAYDYTPLVGLSSLTDINGYTNTFFYDNLNRLSYSKDAQNYVLNNYHYHYANEAAITNLGITPTNTMNYVVSRSARNEQTSNTLSTDVDNTSTQIEYMDGLGRSLQSQIWKASPDKTKDLIGSTSIYDSFGRLSKSLLPTPSDVITGVYKSSALSLATAFYAADSIPFTQTIYEKSPLNRPQKMFGAGGAWRATGNEKFTELSYRIAGTEVIKFDLQSDGSIRYDSLYAPSSLYNDLKISERGIWSIELKDRQGRVVYKFQQLSSTGFVFAITAFVYDDLGRLRTIIQPETYNTINQLRNANQTPKVFTENDNLSLEGVFWYGYDNKGRLFEKRIPGGGKKYFVYDLSDRIVLERDDKDSADGYYLFTKYDALSRPIAKGLLNTTASQSTLQTAFDAITTPYEQIGTDLLGYTNQSFPSSYRPLESDTKQVFYYDDFAFNTDVNYNFKSANAFHSQGNTKGLLTGILIRNLETNDWYKFLNYYDYKGRIIQQFSQNHVGGIDRTDYQYRFNGEILKMRIVHRSDTPQEITEIYEYQTDHLGHKISFKHTLNGVLKNVAKYEYDDIGRLKAKRLSPSSNIGSVSSGSWNATTTWQNNLVPSISDNVTINTGHIVTINAGETGSAGSLFDKGTLKNLGTLQLGILSPSSNIGDLQILNYTYHIRGGLRGINLDANDNLTNTLFSFKLAYEEGTNGYYDSNIRNQYWKSNIDGIQRAYQYTYDGASRLTAAAYGSTKSGEDYALNNVSYDANGNIINLSRNGWKSNNTFGLIDNLNYTYNTNSNKILKVDDASNETASFKDVSGNDYTYYADGSLKSDANKGITLIEYNYLKLPKKITLSGGRWISYQYDANGKKLKKVTSQGTVTDYTSNLIYENNTLYQIGQDEGRIVNGVYEYNITDHLGNLRIAFKDSSGIAKITQVNAYGAFGDDLPTLKYINSLKKNHFGFNLKEEENDFNIGFNDFKWRFSDQILGRFFTIDRLSEKYSELSPYQFASNNPIGKIEIDGLEGVDADNPYIKAYLSKNVQEKLQKANAAGQRSFNYNTSIGPQVGISIKKGDIGIDANAHLTLESSTNSSKTTINLTGGATAKVSAGDNSISLGKIDATIGSAEVKSPNKIKTTISPDINATGVSLPNLNDLKATPINVSGQTKVNQYTNLSNDAKTSSNVDGNNYTFGVSLGAFGSQITANAVQLGEYIKNTTGAIQQFFVNLLDIYTNPEKNKVPDEKQKK